MWRSTASCSRRRRSCQSGAGASDASFMGVVSSRESGHARRAGEAAVNVPCQPSTCHGSVQQGGEDEDQGRARACARGRRSASRSPGRSAGPGRAPRCWSRSRPRTGSVGWGESYGPARPNAAVIEAMKPMLIGADALASEALWERLYAAFRDHGQKGLPVQALSGIDIALWDLKGKHFGVPVHRLMGGPVRTRGPGLCHRPLSARSRRPARLSGRGGRRLRRRGLCRDEAQGRLRGRRGCRGRKRRARGDRAGRGADDRCQPCLRCDPRDPARAPAGRSGHRLVRGAGAARGPRRLRRGARAAADPGRRRRVRVHPLRLSASCSSGARSTWSSRTPAPRAGSRNA